MEAPRSISQQLWADSQVDVLRALHHPFVHSLGDGTLQRQETPHCIDNINAFNLGKVRKSFQFYIAQDAHFLAAFSSAYAAAARKASAVKDTTTAAQLQTLHEGVAKELELHESYAQEWGVELADMLTPSRATQAYVDFLTNIAETKGVAEILAAMTPCSRLYGYLGLELAAAYPQASHAYKDWILTYSSPAYLALPEAKEALMDKLGQHCDFGMGPLQPDSSLIE